MPITGKDTRLYSPLALRDALRDAWFLFSIYDKYRASYVFIAFLPAFSYALKARLMYEQCDKCE